MESKNSRNTWSPFTGEIHGVNIKKKYMESIYRKNTWSPHEEKYMESYKDKYMEPIYIRNMESKYRRSK